MDMDIKFGLFDANGNAITGTALLRCKIKRDSDDLFYDWADGTFKGAGWGTLEGTMTEINAVLIPGEYEIQADTASWADGLYTLYCTYYGSPQQNGQREVQIVNGQVSEEAIVVSEAPTFCGLTTCKLYLGLAGITEHDVLLQEMIEEVTSDFQNYMDRYFFMNIWSEKFDIETGDQACVQLKEYPLALITNVTDAGLSITAADYLSYSGTGQICLDGYYFSKGRQTVEISYWAGYAPANVPKKLRGACREEVARRFRAKDSGDLAYEKIGDYAYRTRSYEDTPRWRTYGWSSSIRRVLDYYRDSPL